MRCWALDRSTCAKALLEGGIACFLFNRFACFLLRKSRSAFVETPEITATKCGAWTICAAPREPNTATIRRRESLDCCIKFWRRASLRKIERVRRKNTFVVLYNDSLWQYLSCGGFVFVLHSCFSAVSAFCDRFSSASCGRLCLVASAFDSGGQGRCRASSRRVAAVSHDLCQLLGL
jgi:hypothetical protein